jgi:hypothetical protein
MYYTQIFYPLNDLASDYRKKGYILSTSYLSLQSHRQLSEEAEEETKDLDKCDFHIVPRFDSHQRHFWC